VGSASGYEFTDEGRICFLKEARIQIDAGGMNIYSNDDARLNR
jgi:hypothetical protein